MDQLWRALEQHICANRKYPGIELHVDAAALWLRDLRELLATYLVTRRRAGA